MARGASSTGSSASVARGVREQAERGWATGVSVFAGDDAYYRDRAIQTVVDALVPQDASDYAVSIYGEDKVDAAAVVGAARSRGMFDCRRVVLVRNFEALDGGPEAFEGYLAAPPADSFLLIRAPIFDQRKKLPKYLAKNARVFRFERREEDPDVLREAAALAKERDLGIPNPAVRYVVESADYDMLRIVNELDKLAAWKGAGDEPLDGDTVRRLVPAGGRMTGWEITNAIQQRRQAEAIAAARKLVTAGEEPIRLLGGIAWCTRSMLQVRALLDAGASPGTVASKVRGGGRLVDAARRYSLAELSTFPNLLAEADVAFKSRSSPSGAILETLVGRLAAPRGTR